MEEPTKLKQALTYSILIIIIGIIITVGVIILSEQKTDICSQPGKCSTTTSTSTTINNYTINFNDQNMIVYYSFDTDTTDDGFRGIDGINGGTTSIGGKIGSARHFNFTNITIPDLSILGLRDHKFTISYWVNKTSGFGDQMVVFSTCPACFGGLGYYGARYPGLVLGWDSGNPNYFASLDQMSWLANAVPLGYFPIIYDTWEMYTIIGDGNSLRTYQQNILVNNISAPSYSFDLQNGTNFILGYQQPLAFGANQLIGSVDEFFYLNRSISQPELDCIYNAGAGQSLKTPINCTAYGAIGSTYTINSTTTTGNAIITQTLDGTQNAMQTFANKTSLLSTVLIAILIVGIIYYFGVKKE